MTNPSITLTNTPTTAVDGYLKSQVAKITYNGTNITSPKYFVKTTREGTSSLAVTKSCGTGTTPGTCTNVTSTKTLTANTWYQVSGNVNVTYSDASDTTGTIYAITNDGTNYSGAATGTLSKIDSIAPSIDVSLNGKTVTFKFSDNVGILSYGVSNSQTEEPSYISVSNSIATWTATKAGIYYVWVQDKVGNKVTQSFEISRNTFCEYETGQVWNFEYTGGIQSFKTPCDGNYKLEVWGAQGGTSICNGSSCSRGGYGGYAVGTKELTMEIVLSIGIGGAGCTNGYYSYGCGGYNGGGNGSGDYNDDESSGGGGGATHIALTNRGILANYSSYKDEILIVAGGGGGASWYNVGNSGGGTGGGGSFGQGSNGNGSGGGSNGMPGGGGGWEGGCNGNGNDSGGQACGGSGYTGGVTGGSMQNGTRSGHGYARITLVSKN